MSVTGIRVIINDAWKIEGLRDKIVTETREINQRIYPFKSLHGFRKYFETECLKVMKELVVSMLMSHDTGITQHYWKPKEEDILLEYRKAIPLLTIDPDEITLNKQIHDLEENNKTNEWVIKGKLQEKDEEINQIKKMHETDICQLREEMNKIFSLIQQNPVLANIKPDVLTNRVET